MKYVVISYVPLLRGNPMETVDLDASNVNSIVNVIESCPSGFADMCLWFMKDDLPSPVFIYDNASEIYDHLIDWSEGAVGDRFKFAIKIHDNKYLVALTPDISKSIQRFKLAREVAVGHSLPNMDAQVIFQSLCFTSDYPGWRLACAQWVFSRCLGRTSRRPPQR